MPADEALEHPFFNSVHNKMIKFASSKNIIFNSVTSKTDVNLSAYSRKNIDNPCLLTLKCDLSPLEPSKRKASYNDSIVVGASRVGSRNLLLKPGHKSSFNSPLDSNNKLSTAISNNDLTTSNKPSSGHKDQDKLEALVGSIPEVNFNSMKTVKAQNVGRRKYTEPGYETTTPNEINNNTKFIDYLSPLKTRGDTNIISSSGSIGDNCENIPNEDIQVMKTFFHKRNPGQMVGKPQGLIQVGYRN